MRGLSETSIIKSKEKLFQLEYIDRKCKMFMSHKQLNIQTIFKYYNRISNIKITCFL